MSFTNLLLGSGNRIDKELNDLFGSNVPSQTIPAPLPPKATSSKRSKIIDDADPPDHSKKKRKVVSEKISLDSGLHTPVLDAPSEAISNRNAGMKKEKTLRQRRSMSDVEASDLRQKTSLEDEDDEVSGGEPSQLVHETVLKGTGKRTKKTLKAYVPEDETPERRNQRTIFIGNLSLEVASKNQFKKQLQRHIVSFVPSAKVESIRFRSIPFQTPTSRLPDVEEESSRGKKEPRAHERDRAAVWRSKPNEKDGEATKADEKKYLSTSQKKKVAFINQEFHSTADTINAYLVFSHPANADDRPKNLPPIPQTLDPYEAARQAAAKADGSLFLGRILRVDMVTRITDAGAAESTSYTPLDVDPQLSLFVGNLDFESKEEDLREFFEGLLSSERGPPLVETAHTDEDAGSLLKKPLTWVTRVRIVRDKDTQLGKGFAYLQFSDRECVDELLAMEESKLKFSKRKLRVQRCKTIPGVKMPTVSRGKQPIAPQSTPKGDPALGEKLAGLGKEERKRLKSADKDRVARRLAKKKSRMGMTMRGPKNSQSTLTGKGRPPTTKKDKERKRPHIKS